MEKMQEYPQRICRKCLLRDMEEGNYFETMRNYINGLDEEIKADKRCYEERLALCSECDKLISGMCRICGCFVEMRAAVRHNACPLTPARW